MSEAQAWTKFAAAGVGKLLGLPVDTGFFVERLFAYLDADKKRRAHDLSERAADALAAARHGKDPGLVEGARTTAEELLREWGLRDEELARHVPDDGAAADSVLQHARFDGRDTAERELCRQLLIAFYCSVRTSATTFSELLPHLQAEQLRLAHQADDKLDRQAETLSALPAEMRAAAEAAMSGLREQYEHRLREAERQSEIDRDTIRAQNEAILALAARGADPRATAEETRSVEDALVALRTGDAGAAEAIFEDIVRSKRAESAGKAAEAEAARAEAAKAARHLAALAIAEGSEPALTAWRRAAELDPEDIWTWIFISRLESMQGRLGKAAEASIRAFDLARAAGREREESVAQNEIGNVRVAQGEPEAALVAFEAAKAIAERVAGADPDNAKLQRDLSVSLERIGDVRLAQGELGAALVAYKADKAIAKRLARADPQNARLQSDLSMSLNKLGDVLMAQGKLRAALAAYKAGESIRECLVAANPHIARWQRDLSASRERIGDVRVAQGENGEALVAYEAGMEVAEGLAEADPNNAGWQRDLAVSNVKLGDIKQASDPAAARKHYEAALAVVRRLVETGRQAPADAWMEADLEQRLGKDGRCLTKLSK